MKTMTGNENKVMDYIKDQMQQGKMTAEEANVYKVRAFRFQLITKLPRNVRKSLNVAVKSGELGHLKKDGLMPEAYFHPKFRHMALAARRKEKGKGIRALMSVAV